MVNYYDGRINGAGLVQYFSAQGTTSLISYSQNVIRAVFSRKEVERFMLEECLDFNAVEKDILYLTLEEKVHCVSAFLNEDDLIKHDDKLYDELLTMLRPDLPECNLYDELVKKLFE